LELERQAGARPTLRDEALPQNGLLLNDYGLHDRLPMLNDLPLHDELPLLLNDDRLDVLSLNQLNRLDVLNDRSDLNELDRLSVDRLHLLNRAEAERAVIRRRGRTEHGTSDQHGNEAEHEREQRNLRKLHRKPSMEHGDQKPVFDGPATVISCRIRGLTRGDQTYLPSGRLSSPFSAKIAARSSTCRQSQRQADDPFPRTGAIFPLQ
jgi:hypothetical protein